MSSFYCNLYESNRELIDCDHYPQYRFSWVGRKNFITIRQQHSPSGIGIQQIHPDAKLSNPATIVNYSNIDCQCGYNGGNIN